MFEIACLQNPVQPWNQARRLPKFVEFTEFTLNKVDDESYFKQIMLTDEATFYINGCVNCHNCRIWETQ